MKDYFADLISRRVTSVARGNTPLNPKEINVFDKQASVTPRPLLRGNEGNQSCKWIHHVTYSETEKVTEKAKEIIESHQLLLATPINGEDWLHSYNERAAIMEFDSVLSRNEAEKAAYKEVLSMFLKECYPKIVGQFESIIQQTLIN